MNWETVIGIEIHVQLSTGRKLFCRDRAVFGDAPNTHVCPVCLGLPGALPVPDPEAVALAVRAALAFGCEVQEESLWARKNYFYPDLPKGYQITQFESPIATGGAVVFDGADGPATVRLTRIHMEEDAGKSVHDRVPGATAVDLNRAGTPLIEIVTEPDLSSAADTRAFLGALKQTLEYVDVSDCNMEEGSLRADANVSVRRSGETRLGTKTEIKNVNSFSGIERALEIEIARQVQVLEGGGTVVQATLLWDDHVGRLRTMRTKEESHDYRYFPDPDLRPLHITRGAIEAARSELPELPRARRERFVIALGLPAYDAGVLTQDASTADYFESVARATGDAKSASNWVMGPAQALMRERGEGAGTFAVRPGTLAELIRLVAVGAVSDTAAKRVLPLLAESGRSPMDVIESEGLLQVRDEAALDAWIEEVLAAHTDEVGRYRGGELRLLGFLVGRVMRASGGAADPRRVNERVVERLADG